MTSHLLGFSIIIIIIITTTTTTIYYVVVLKERVSRPTPSTVPNLFVLRSASFDNLFVPRARLQFGNRTFCMAGFVAQNGFPLHIRSEPTL